MATRDAVRDSIVKWCTKQRWDWMLALPTVAASTPEVRDRIFHKWTYEIELADGTLAFRWARFIPRQGRGLTDEFYVAVGGLSGGHWRWWSKRWSALCGDPEARGGYVYCYRRQGNRFPSILKETLFDKKYDIEIRIGPRTIQRVRTLQVDEDGMPKKKAILEAPAFRKGEPK